MRAKELRQKSKEDLRTLLRERQDRADALPALLREKKVKNVKELYAAKKDIARILTLLRI